VVKNTNRQVNPESELYMVVNKITSIIEKYTDQIELLDVIDIVDNLRALVEMAETAKANGKNINVA